FAQRKCKFGMQKELLYGARVYVLPSSSGENANAQKERLAHFRKLAQPIRKAEKARDAQAERGETMRQGALATAPVLLESVRGGVALRVWSRAERMNAR